MSSSQKSDNDLQVYVMANSPKHTGLRPPTGHKDSSNSELPDLKQEENQTPPKGRIAGGSFLEQMRGSDSDNTEDGPLKEVEIDMPETRTEIISKDGEEFILLQFADGDPENPFNWPAGKKVFITMLLCMMTLFIGLATTAYSSGITRMCDDFGVSTELGQLGLFCFNMACALAPLFLAPFCELVGRKIIYTGAYAGFIICFIGLALGKNIATILVMRTLSGLFGCVGTILVGGTFSDMYTPDQRAVPMACFAYVAILGTVGAPIYAGFIDETIGWRWIEGIQGLANLPLLAAILFFFRETRGGVALHKRAKRLRAATGDERYKADMDLEAKDLKEMLHNSSVKAVKMLATEPVVFAFGLWIAFAWFVTFLFLSVIPITFQENHGWNEGISGLPYISLCIGVTIAFALNFLQIRKYKSIMADHNNQIVPESRLYGAMCGACFLPIGLFIYSFTQYGFVTWVAPAIALAPISMGIFFIFESTYSYTADCYGENSSSAIAGQGLMRNALGAVAPLFASQFFHNVGSQYAGLILALAGTALTAIPFVMFKYGHLLRARSKLASTQKGGQEQKEKTGLYPAPFI
ncbi:putative MFS transporter [Sclerotinia borealis F-4128]|uniref:Putative MFS transporter n=1 Tax=Sclerotinia borealis (strain F-4128) TaxID=1432307 RepID=W9C498_SCLBF|nr:putative MFS transporter [Sclerotinia borealis F-4128]